MKITPTSLTVSQIFSATNEQYTIPSYQRRYSWSNPQVWDLIDDINLLEDSDSHLLGSIVCLTGLYTAGITPLELVDGQQRLTTIAIFLECIRQRLESLGEADDAKDVARLLTAKAQGGPPVQKLKLDSMDAADFDALLARDESRTIQNQRLAGTFQTIRSWIEGRSAELINKFTYRLCNQAMIIRLDVGNAKDAFKLFETINNRGLRLSPTDIIKNFILGNAARFDAASLEIARRAWTDLLINLDGIKPDIFFRYFLMTQLRTRLTISEIVPTFKKLFMQRVNEAQGLPERHLYTESADEDDEEVQDVDSSAESEVKVKEDIPSNDLSFKSFLALIVRYSGIFATLLNCNSGDARIDRHLRNLRMIKAVQTYGLLMHLRANGCDDKTFLDVLKLTESFVLRRHTSRERANETEALFAKLSAVNAKSPLDQVREEYRALCPSDAKFQEEFARTSYVTNIMDRARYCLEQFELARHGGALPELQVLGSADVHVEHIIPQKISTKRSKSEFGDWLSYLGTDAEKNHKNYVGRIGNLTLFSGALNISASNHPFSKKKPSYKASSLELTKELAEQTEFRFEEVEKRSQALAEEAVKRWPAP